MTEPEPSPEEIKPKGRPRPEETKARDAQVLQIVIDAGTAGVTRQAIAQALGESTKTSHAYLSLFRLHRDGQVERVRIAGKHAWVTAENAALLTEPAPVA